MDATQYQGLFYLSLGVGGFLSFMLGLRAFSQPSYTKLSADDGEDHSWKHKEQLLITHVIDETADVKTFRFKRQSGKFPEFSPGQFLSFQIGDDEKCLRSYSISETTTNQHVLQVSIKKLSNGVGSGWFHERKVGDKVWVFPPNGLFTDCGFADDQQRIYVAGGIGITPFMSMIQTNIDKLKNVEMNLFYGSRTSSDLAFGELLRYFSQRYDNFNYFPILSDQDASWSGDQGYITLDFIKSKVSINEDAQFMFCGPPVMTDTIIDQLLATGFNEEQIHSEKFASPVSFDPDNISERSAVINYRGQDYDYQGKQTILEFLEGNGVEIPYACRVGVCGTCKCQVEGRVDEITDAGLTTIEKKKGLFLPCVAFPEEDIKIS